MSGIAARRDYTLEQVDDLRMAVEEAAVLLLRHADGAPLELEALIEDRFLQIELSTDVKPPETIVDTSSFSWKILEALTDEVSAALDGTRASLRLVKHRLHDDGGVRG